VTKHAIGLYSSEPPEHPFRHRDVQEEVDTFPRRAVDGSYQGPVVIEAYTVMHGHEGPEVALVTALTPEGVRVLARTDDGPTMASFMVEEPIGRAAEVGPDATIAI
jgi:acetyl-CoA C-acetyltransferase